jgi:CRP-like cAMP-binding protein
MLLLGEKNYGLNQKIELLMLKGMKEKIATYLLSERQRHGNDSFNLPMNRNELADYLNVSRPSMSRELSRMQAQGLLTFHKNHFQLLEIEELIDCIENSD